MRITAATPPNTVVLSPGGHEVVLTPVDGQSPAETPTETAAWTECRRSA